ncbi:MAG: SAM-dependent methyltransferase [Cyanobacteria bacterium MAG CAR3_bin_5]|nr:SAM-dependent methyltransferase [Cyanobacteria bacterium MAG CAR3_bin_5]
MMPTSQDRTNFPEDFLDAMDRHWQDAELLRRKERLANADHLYGLSAECGLKALMKKLGMRMQGNRPQDRGDRKHVHALWGRYESYRDHYIEGPRFSLPWQPDNIPFANWDISDRYANRNRFTEERLEGHRSGAKDVKQLVARLEREGLFP